MPYWRAKTDENHADIRKDFKAAGWQWLDLHRLKGACDGLVLSPAGRLYLIEVKRLEGKRKPKASTNANQSTKDRQKDFATVWPVVVLTSTQAAAKWRNETAELERQEEDRIAV